MSKGSKLCVDATCWMEVSSSWLLNKHVEYDVYRLNPDTGAIEKLTNQNGYATELKVSADGKIAAFLKWHRNWKGVTDPEPYLLDVPTHKVMPLKVSGLN